ncbi:DedA family protein [Desulfotomaculum nigrificans]|uniref:DedA family protein n=1 Tax=Desulfotomaculum nigrificans TaxID=1565 RepID=UPI0001FAE4FB|nr:DedA family protein [Desulfotomaculum nigrificans]
MTDKICAIFGELGLIGLFLGICLEALGLPFPGSVLLGVTGFLSRQGKFNIFLAWTVAIAGYMIGSTAAFLIGRHIGEPFMLRWGKYIHLTPDRFEQAKGWLTRSAPGFIIGGRFIPTVGNITPYVAGISGIPLTKFLLYDFVHASLWLTTFLGAGSLLGNNWQRVMNSQWTKWVWVIIIFIFSFYFLRRNLVNKTKI